MAQAGLIKRLQKQTGAGMMEVLIALVISAFALLGLAGLQVSSLRYQKGANFRALATQYAADMSDRIRANLAGARAGDYNFALQTYSNHPPAAQGSNPCDGANRASCTPSVLAAQDLYNWRVRLSQGLTGGWGEVSGDRVNGFVIRVYFFEPNKTVADPNCRPAAGAGAEVRCFVTVFYP